MAKLAVIIPAAGSGSRMGSRLPKPFLNLNGEQILLHTIRNFLGVPGLTQVLVPTSKEWIPVVSEMLASLNVEGVSLQVVEGGSERQFSIWNALQVLDEDIELVAVHDAVRPFISVKLIEECCAKALKTGGAIIAVPAKDTIKRVKENGEIEDTPDRRFLWQAQTPQVFRKDIVVKAYESAITDEFVGTDDSSLVERIGGKVSVVEGDRENLKITYPVDLKIAELILSGRN